MTTKEALIHIDLSVEFREIPIPTPKEGEILIKVDVVGM